MKCQLRKLVEERDLQREREREKNPPVRTTSKIPVIGTSQTPVRTQ